MMCQQMTTWRKFLGLKCDKMEEFPLFYADVKTSLNKLEEEKSVAVRDDIFLKCFLSQKIEVTELEQTTKAFVMENNQTYAVTLEQVRADYQAQQVKDSLREGGTFGHLHSRRGTSTVASASTAGASSSRTESTITRIPKKSEPGLGKLPPNTGNLIPYQFYT